MKAGDLVARTRTRKVVSKPTDKKDVSFKIIEIKASTVIGEDGNRHYINNLHHVRRDE